VISQQGLNRPGMVSLEPLRKLFHWELIGINFVNKYPFKHNFIPILVNKYYYLYLINNNLSFYNHLLSFLAACIYFQWKSNSILIQFQQTFLYEFR